MKAIAVQADALTSRMAALDVLRGLTVMGMIIVNTASYLHDPLGFPAYPMLLHSAWAGFTLADAVFPSFIVMVGVSIACALARARAAGGAVRDAAFTNVWARAARLLFIGFLISNLYWLQSPDDGHIRVFGVLQRIGFVYLACASLYLTVGFRRRLLIAAGLLLAYWPLTLLPTPDGPARLLEPGQNIVSWVERAMLGVHIYVHGPQGYDPEGLLSTIPAIAQGLIGVAIGEWMISRGPSLSTARVLAWGGAVVTLAGLAWCSVYPPIKSIWTSSYVLLSTGPVLMLLGLLYWMLDLKGIKPWGYTVMMAFGVNAVTAYVLHEVASVALLSPPVSWMYQAAARVAPPDAAALLPTAAFTAMVWAPIAYLYRRRWVMKI